MASKLTKKSLVLVLGLIITLSLSFVPVRTLALSQGVYGPADTALMQFVQTVESGQSQVTGVYSANMFSFPVVQQPVDNAGFVSTEANTVTQFGMASQQHNIGLLAHNFLAGQSFFGLLPGSRIYLVYGTGRVEAFTVTEVLQYQALEPENMFSQFREVGGSETISSTDMFNRVYTGAYHLTLQTCIERDGNGSWGRLFVIAEPIVTPIF